MTTPFERYRVDQGATVRLDDWPTRDDAAFDGDKDDGEDRLDELTKELAALQDLLYADGSSKALLVLQAMDTAGKDSTIRDVFLRTNPLGTLAVGFGVPSEEELGHDYLWRIHQHAPANGQISILNRSHYEDVLVVRVHSLVPEKRWRRRYRHIREFEQMLTDEGTVIRKFFLHISLDEQAERLQERLDEPEKRWKFNPADLSERKRWRDYMDAYEEAIAETSTDAAPWYVIPSDRRWYRKLAVAEITAQALRDLDLRYPDPPDGLDDLVIE